jgi:hypothetical protein
MDEAGNPKMGWFFVPKGYLVATRTPFSEPIEGQKEKATENPSG